MVVDREFAEQLVEDLQRALDWACTVNGAPSLDAERGASMAQDVLDTLEELRLDDGLPDDVLLGRVRGLLRDPVHALDEWTLRWADGELMPIEGWCSAVAGVAAAVAYLRGELDQPVAAATGPGSG